MSTDSDPNCAPGDGQIQGNREDVRVAECPVGIPEECGAMDDMDNKSNDALGGALDMGSSGDSEENECGRNDEEDNSEGAELSMKYPGAALERKLDLKWSERSMGRGLFGNYIAPGVARNAQLSPWRLLRPQGAGKVGIPAGQKTLRVPQENHQEVDGNAPRRKVRRDRQRACARRRERPKLQVQGVGRDVV